MGVYMNRRVRFVFLGILALGVLEALHPLSSFAKKTDDPSFPKDWQVCKADADCVVIKGVCGNWDCVNVSGRNELDKVNRNMEKKYGCGPSPVTPKPQPKAFCSPKGCRCQVPAAAKSGW